MSVPAIPRIGSSNGLDPRWAELIEAELIRAETTVGRPTEPPLRRCIDTPVRPDVAQDRLDKTRRRSSVAWGIVSVLGHGALTVVLLTVVQPPMREASTPYGGISMVFADVVGPAPALMAAPPLSDAAPDPAPFSPDPAPPSPDPAPPSPDVARPLAVVATAEPSLQTKPISPQQTPPIAAMPQRPPPAPAPAQPTPAARTPITAPHPRANRVASGAPAEADVLTAGQPRAAAILPPRPIAGMATNRPPRYPESARRRQEQGRVMVRVSVAIDGTPTDTRIDASSGHPALDEAAMDAVRQWRFLPARQNDRPVVASAEVPIVFRLED
jgi:periplasmic protein TonB